MNISPELSNDELRSLAADVARLSKLLTREREDLPAAYLKDAGLRKAYQTYFLPQISPRSTSRFRNCHSIPRGLFAKAKIHVLDIGAGPGTASLGVLTFFSQQERKPQLEFTIVDQVAENLKMAEALFLSSRTNACARGFIENNPVRRSRIEKLSERTF